ncbi:MAG: ABC transporter permease [Anaerolineae bacterium]|jgi:ABC-2 type transport system permease protein
MNALNIALKDLSILLKDRGAVIQLFLLPLLFIVVFSGALTAIGSAEEATAAPAVERIPLAVVDLDGGETAQSLLDGLQAAGDVQVTRYEQDRALSMLDEKELDRVLTIPAGFSTDLAESRQATLRLINHPDADAEESKAAQLAVESVATDMALQRQILASLQHMGEMQANAPPEYQEAFSTERLQAQAQEQFEREQTLVEVVRRFPEQQGERQEMPDAAQLAVPGFSILFVFLTAQTTARSIYDEKKVGSFRRLLAAPMSKASLLVGKMLPNFVTGLIQIGVIFAFGAIGLRLIGLTPMTLGEAPLVVALVAVLVALCSSGLGVLIAAIARTENQIGGLSAVILWIMGVLGGSFIPLFFLENFLGPLPKIVPHYWANRAFNDLMIRGLGLAEVTVEMAVLLGFTGLFFLVGLWRFDFD